MPTLSALHLPALCNAKPISPGGGIIGFLSIRVKICEEKRKFYNKKSPLESGGFF
jgi:hypothetical protein